MVKSRADAYTDADAAAVGSTNSMLACLLRALWNNSIRWRNIAYSMKKRS